MTTDPGAPRTDELARSAAYNALRDDHQLTAEEAFDITGRHTVTWETDVNSAGVPVRRYVLRGAWEVDPNAAALPAGRSPRGAATAPARTEADMPWETDPYDRHHPEMLRKTPPESGPPPAAPAAGPDGDVEWRQHTHEMWVGEAYGAKVLVEIDPNATSRREKWRAVAFGGTTISRAPLTLAKAKHDGFKYLWSRRRGADLTPTRESARAAEAMMTPGLLHGIAETYGPHPFVRQSYKGRQIDACAHFTRVSSHEASICGAAADDPIHVGGRVPIGCNACGLTDVPPDHLCTLI